MRIRILGITLVLFFWQFASAQQSEPFYKSSKERFGWFLNPGVSVGFGGYRAFNAVPMIALKTGPFHFSGMYIPGSRTDLACYGVGLDIFQFSDSKGRSNAIGLTAGYSSLQRDPEFYRAYQSHDLLLSYSRYRPGSKARWTVYGGVKWLQEQNNLVVQYENQQFLPWVGLSLDLYAMRLPEYRDKPDNDSISLLPRIYRSNAFFSKGFNPGFGVGMGTGYGGSIGYAFQINISSAYVKIGKSFDVNPDPITSATSVQVGLNFYRFRLHPAMATFGTLSSDFTVQRYNCGSIESPEWCLDNYSRGSVLTGINGYFYDSRFSFSAKMGVGWRNGTSMNQEFTTDQAIYPAGELGFHIHFFKFRRIAYDGNLVWDKEEGVVQPEKVNPRGDSLSVGDVFNLFVSVGGGMDHPVFFGPTVGIQIFRIYLSSGYFVFNENPAVSITGDIEAGFFNKTTSLLIGGSHSKWNGDRKISAINLGVNYRLGQRSRINAKAGLGLYSVGLTENWIPVGSLSYQFNLFKF